jgi:hypothetical protein
VVLPKGAEVVFANPWPVSSFTLQGKPILRFEGTRARDDNLKYTIQYRLVQDASD